MLFLGRGLLSQYKSRYTYGRWSVSQGYILFTVTMFLLFYLNFSSRKHTMSFVSIGMLHDIIKWILVAAVSLDSQCRYNEECQHGDSNTVCLQVTSTSSYCRCAQDYEKLLLSDRSQCIQSKASPTTHTVPTLAGLGIGLSVLTCFLCFTLRLFSKARTMETRYECLNLLSKWDGIFMSSFSMKALGR